jgi:hypothetical protein
MSKAKTFVHLRIYKGNKILKDENGVIQTENQIVKIQSGTVEFERYMKKLPVSGYGKVEIEKCVEVKGVGENQQVTEVETPKEVTALYNAIFVAKQEEALTPEQKRIKELEEHNKAMEKRLARLEGGNSQPATSDAATEPTQAPEPPQAPEEDENVLTPKQKLRAEYKELTGNNAPGVWSEEKIASEIEAIKSKKVNQ